MGGVKLQLSGKKEETPIRLLLLLIFTFTGAEDKF
jgi:hypothetical protein